MNGIGPITPYDHRLTPAIYPHDEVAYHMELLKDCGVTFQGKADENPIRASVQLMLSTDTGQSIGEQVVEELTGVIESITKRRVMLLEVER